MRARPGAVVIAALAVSLFGASGAWGATSATIDVFPGPNAIQNAVNAANNGDTLRIHAGTYNEGVTVNKDNLTLVSAGDGKVVVNGGCAHTAVFEVDGDGVTINKLQIRGGSFFGVNFAFVNGGSVIRNQIKDTCPDAEYGVNVFAVTGTMTITNNKTSGYADAGIYIGGITSGTQIIANNRTFKNNRGIIVEDSTPAADIQVNGNNVTNNTAPGEGPPSGIFLHNSDGVTIDGNSVTDNGSGIELDPNSDGNLVQNNTLSGNSPNLLNNGTNNCFMNNNPNVVTGNPSSC